MEIPWDRFFMYMNPSEFSILPPGAIVQKVKCTIVSRGVFETFPTNSTENRNAALNGVYDIAVGSGLLQSVDSLNLMLKNVSSTKPMLATEWAENSDQYYRDMRSGFYGSPNDASDFDNLLPCSLIDHPLHLRNYLALYADKNNANKPGWPELNKHYNVFDARAVQGKIVLEKTYEPQISICGKPLEAIINQYPFSANSVLNIPYGTRSQFWGKKTFLTGSAKITQTTTSSQNNAPFKDAPDSINLIEQSQYVFHQGAPGFSGQTQPTIHVGVLPMLKQSANNVISQDSDYVDLQAYFDVKCEMEVLTSYGTCYPQPSFPNCHYTNQYMYIPANSKLMYEGTMFEGMYRTK